MFMPTQPYRRNNANVRRDDNDSVTSHADIQQTSYKQQSPSDVDHNRVANQPAWLLNRNERSYRPLEPVSLNDCCKSLCYRVSMLVALGLFITISTLTIVVVMHYVNATSSMVMQLSPNPSLNIHIENNDGNIHKTSSLKEFRDTQSLFYYPDVVHYGLLESQANPCQDMFRFSCGRWKEQTKRFFHQTHIENQQSLSDVNYVIRNGMSSMLTDINNPLYQYTNDVIKYVEDHTISPSSIKAMLSYDVQAGSYESRAADNVHMFYRTCMRFHQQRQQSAIETLETDSTALPTTLHPHIQSLIEWIEQHMTDRTTRSQYRQVLASAFGYLHRHGISVPIDVGAREMAYDDTATMNVDSNARPVVLMFDAGGVWGIKPTLVGDIPDITPDGSWNTIQQWTVVQPVGKSTPLTTTLQRFQQQVHHVLTTPAHDLRDAPPWDIWIRALTVEQRLREAITSMSPQSLAHSLNDKLQQIRDKYQEFRYDHLKGLMHELDLSTFVQHADILPNGNSVIPDDQHVFVPHPEYFANLDVALTQFSPAQWRAYFIYTILKSSLNSMDMSTNSKPITADVQCMAITKRMFPTAVCRMFRHTIIEFDHAQNIASQVVQRVMKQTRRLLIDSFDATPDHLRRFDALEVSLGECTLSDAEQRISHVISHESDMLDGSETLYHILRTELAREDVPDFFDIVSKLITDQRFRLHRHRKAYYDSWSVDMDTTPATINEQQSTITKPGDDEYGDTNAWYDMVHHRVVVPPGLIRFPIISGLYDEVSRYAMFGFIVGHEIAHATERLFHKTKRESEQFKCLATHYATPWNSNNRQSTTSSNSRRYGEQTFFENRADVIGMRTAYEAMVKARGMPTPEIIQQFFIAVSQIWCVRDDSGTSLINFIASSGGDEVHALPRDRVNRPIGQLGNELREKFESVFQCQFATSTNNDDDTKSCIF